MGIFNEVTKTVKNIFNGDDEMMFDDENEFKEPASSGQNFKFSFGKKEQSKKVSMPQMPTFDASKYNFSMDQSGQARRNKSTGRIQVYVPKTFEEAFSIIKDVKAGVTAMVNVEVANPQISQRIADIISGAIYALDGDCKKMGEKQYIFSLSTETIGAYDYLPVNGHPSQNMWGSPQPQMGWAPQSQPQATPNFNFMNQQVTFPEQVADNMKSYYVPPKSQF